MDNNNNTKKKSNSNINANQKKKTNKNSNKYYGKRNYNSKSNNNEKKKTIVANEKALKGQTIEIKNINELEEKEIINKVFSEEQPENLVAKENIKIVEHNKKERQIDYGILINVICLLILLVVTFLTQNTDIDEKITNPIIILALVLEVIGIIVIIYNSIKKEK